jgi:Trk K+ transport system NAD-binding subunit
VLAVQDAANPQSGFAPITPDRPLKDGDELIAAGRPQDVRQFMRVLENEGSPSDARIVTQSGPTKT